MFGYSMFGNMLGMHCTPLPPVASSSRWTTVEFGERVVFSPLLAKQWLRPGLPITSELNMSLCVNI
jgi:hypothetical protein